jgi:hypothetical protein
MGWGQVQAKKQAVEGSDPHEGHVYVSEGDAAVCSETVAFKLQTPGNHPEESVQQAVVMTRHCHLLLHIVLMFKGYCAVTIRCCCKSHLSDYRSGQMQ